MDIFHIETGAIPAGTIHEEAVPMLHGHSSSSKGGSSKAFLVHDSLTCITNVSLGFSNCGFNEHGLVKGLHTQDESPEDKRTIIHMIDCKSPNETKSGSSEFRCLSPKNLKDPAVSPARSATKGDLDEKLPESETENLLQPRRLDLGRKESSSKKYVKRLPLEEKDFVSSSSASMYCKPEQASVTSSSEEAPNSGQPSNVSESSRYNNKLPSTSSLSESQEIPRKKTLEELAKEWRVSQKNELDGTPKQLSSSYDEESMLVRHTCYYTTSTSDNDVSREERRLRNKLKARMHLNEDNVKRLSNYGGQPLVKLTRD